MKTFIAATLAVGLLSAPQIALAAPAPQTVNIAISADGLDLSRASDMRRLRNRIADAAAEACDPADRMIVTPMPDYQCRRAAIASVEPMVQELALAARSGKMARR
ncbi:UrcA family protein [Novosphingobium sp. CCH12-A3]|uniref:UrcA family protein n=1 Tax=Novosphingobium sp. CCH12-A3 TaxID=1768752 RepID=UPI0007828B4B|nr:UrcA family protein [Novosphingobium sp. CCH12-A3]